MQSRGIQEFKEPADFIRQRAIELIRVDHSWSAFFCGKAFARRRAGFDADELNLIAEQNRADKLNYQTNYILPSLTPSPYLDKRAKELECVDSSWKLIFHCISKENLHRQAGFTELELFRIEAQRKNEFKKQLKNEKYLRKRCSDLMKEDLSWKAFFFGKDYARTSAGFTSAEIDAINEQKETDTKASQARAAAARKKYKNPKEREKVEFKVDEIRQRQAERKDYISLLKAKK